MHYNELFIKSERKYLTIIFLIMVSFYFILSFYRFPYADEAYYLLETSNMADILSKGQWIGNDAVGLHGFLFKLPVAVLFIIFGHSVFLATIYHILLSVVTVYLFYKLIERYFNEDYLRIIGVLLFITSLFFVKTTISFLREIPVVFSLLLFLNLLCSEKKRKILIGISLLLILDAKEHVFFQIAPGFSLWLLYFHFIKNRGNNFLKNFRFFIVDSMYYYFPVLLYLFLMFFTSIVPVNMFVAYILGLIERGFTAVKNSFILSGTYAGIDDDELELTQLAEYFNLNSKFFNNYSIKFFLPTIFSIQTVPKIIAMPAFIISWLKTFSKESDLKEDGKLFFFILWSYLITFYLRASHGRYFFPISPLIIIFFLLFLKNLIYNRQSLFIIIFTFIAIVVGFLFEYKSVLVKIFLNILLMLSLIILLYNNQKKRWDKRIVYLGFGILMSFVTFSVSISYLINIGQLKYSLIHGYCGDTDKISCNIDNNLKILINDNSEKGMDLNQIRFYRKERILAPEWKYSLLEYLPKKRMLKYYRSYKTLAFEFDDMQELHEKLFINNIDYIYFLFSTSTMRSYYKQEEIEIIKSQNFLDLDNTIYLKNKIIYILKVLK